jgi:hypothetical protein
VKRSVALRLSNKQAKEETHRDIEKVLYFIVISHFCFRLAVYPQTTGRDVSKSGTTAANFLQIPSALVRSAWAVRIRRNGERHHKFVLESRRSSTAYSREVVFSHMEWLADIDFDFGAVAIPLRGIGTLGLSFTALSMDDMLVRTVERPEGTGELFSAGSIAIGMHYARNLTDNFSIGFSAKFLSERIWDMSAQGFAIDFGTLFHNELSLTGCASVRP